VDVRGAELSLKVEAASPGESHIEHQAGRSVRTAGLEEFVHRGEQLRLQLDGSKQATDRLSDGGSSSTTITVDIASGIVSTHRPADESKFTSPRVVPAPPPSIWPGGGHG